jgi:hypothetical protein
MARKIKLTESQLTDIIEKVINTKRRNLKEDSEGEETYHYGEDEGRDRREEEGLEHEKHLAPHDRIGEIERHLDALKKDMAYDEDHEDRGEEGTHFAESRRRRKSLREDALPSGDMSKLTSCFVSHFPVTDKFVPGRACVGSVLALSDGNITEALSLGIECGLSIPNLSTSTLKNINQYIQEVHACYSDNTM